MLGTRPINVLMQTDNSNKAYVHDLGFIDICRSMTVGCNFSFTFLNSNGALGLGE